MNDKELIDLIANSWIDNGGDAEGFVWLWSKIHQIIEELKRSKKDEK